MFDSPHNILQPAGAVPAAAQLAYHEDELAAFLHFGVNTFTDKEWGDGTEDPMIFAPDDWKATEMVQSLLDAGFKRLIVTAKHHDGFCIWHTQYTDHHVGNSPFKRDILAELSAACSKLGMDMGLYLSPWDVHEPSYGYGEGDSPETDTNGDYNDYYVNQINEINESPLYGRDGQFVEWWLDGAKGEGSMAQTYDFPRWLEAIRAGNPEIGIFGAAAEGGIYWVGNEEGFAPEPCWCKLDSSYTDYGVQPKGIPLGDVWSVPETDVSLNKGWFYHSDEKAKTPAHLAAIYIRSVGRGSPLLLNVPPTRAGDYAPDAYEALQIFGDSWRQTRKAKLTCTAEQIETSSSSDMRAAEGAEVLHIFGDNAVVAELTWSFPEAQSFSLISLSEPIEWGQRIDGFELDLLTDDDVWIECSGGGSIGHLRLVTLDLVKNRGKGMLFKGLRIRFRALERLTPIVLRSVALHDLAPAWDSPELYKWLAVEAPNSVPGWKIADS